MIVNKANKVLGSIKHSVGTANANVFFMMYDETSNKTGS